MATEELTGSALDAEIERRVFGGDVIRCPRNGVWGYRWNGTEDIIDTKSIPPYSKSVSGAWKIIEKLAAHPQFVDFSMGFNVYRAQDHPERGWSAAFGLYDHGEGFTAAEAICRAALRAIDRLDSLERHAQGRND